MRENTEQYSGKLSLRIPKSLHRELIEAAAYEGVSLNQYVMYRIAKSEPTYNLETLQALYDASHGIGLSKPYSTAHELMKDILDGDDEC